MNQTIYHIERMDCAAEEQMVRMRLGGVDGIHRLAFDLPARRLVVIHEGDASPITTALDSLRLDTQHIDTEPVAEELLGSVIGSDATGDAKERKPLIIALVINAAFFVGELAAGLVSGSMGLVADSLDMLADALVYALSLAAVGGTMLRKKQLARTSGYLQLGLAVFGVVEVIRRFVVGESAPDVATMVIVAALALVGNVATLLILSKARGAGGSGEAHVEASWIFTSNDIKVNGLVILSALLVWATSSGLPDLLAGGFIFLIVANGARQILALSR